MSSFSAYIVLNIFQIVKVLDPEPGNWSITVGSSAEHSVKVVGLSNLTFSHGFSVLPLTSMADTSYRPLQGKTTFIEKRCILNENVIEYSLI